MYETKIKISQDEENIIANSLKGNFSQIKYLRSLKDFRYNRFFPHFVRIYLRYIIGILNSRQKKIICNFDFTNSIDLSINSENNSWPNNKKCVFISTHDIDTEFGQEYIENFFEIENNLKLRSTNFWVTHLYELNHTLLKQVLKNGFEIGLHDYNHDGKLAMLSQEEIKKRIDYSKDFIKEYSVKGIRSPGFLRSLNFYSVIKDLFDYDMSIVDYSFLFPFPGDGCRSSFPLYLGELLLIPCSLLRDGEGVSLGLKPKEILDIWIKKYNWLKSKNSVIVLLTHPDKGFSGNKEMLLTYKAFLEYVGNDNECWISTACELNNFFKQRKENLINLSLNEVLEKN